MIDRSFCPTLSTNLVLPNLTFVTSAQSKMNGCLHTVHSLLYSDISKSVLKSVARAATGTILDL